MSMPGVTADESLRLNALWSIADRAGLHRCSANLEAALIAYEEALDAKRAVDSEVADARTDHEAAVGLAEMAASRHITREGNRTFVPDADSDGGRRQVTADEARTWLARHVAEDPDVRDAAAALTAATVRLEERKDRIAVTERRIQIAKYTTDSAVALTDLLSHAFKENK